MSDFYLETDEEKKQEDFCYSDEQVIMLLIKLVISFQSSISVRKEKNEVVREISKGFLKHNIEELLDV